MRIGPFTEVLLKRLSLRSVLPVWHLTGTAHVESLDHSAQAIGYHRDDILTIGVALRRLHHWLGVQQQRGIFAGNRRVDLLLFQEEWRKVISWGWGCCVCALLIQLGGDEDQPFIKRVPQQLQRLDSNKRTSLQHRCAVQDQSRLCFVRQLWFSNCERQFHSPAACMLICAVVDTRVMWCIDV